jgi:hypothetical protein
MVRLKSSGHPSVCSVAEHKDWSCKIMDTWKLSLFVHKIEFFVYLLIKEMKPS